MNWQSEATFLSFFFFFFAVCPTTMKRICRQHGISRWPSRKINKVNRSLSKLKRVIESVQGAEGAFNLPSIACQLPIGVSLDGGKHGEDARPSSVQHDVVRKDSLPHNLLQSDDEFNAIKVQQETVLGPADSPLEPDKDSSKTSSSGEGSTDAPTSQDSSEEVNHVVLSDLRNDFTVSDPVGLNNSMPRINVEDPQSVLGGTLMEDSGSSKDLKNLFNCVMEGFQDEGAVVHANRDLSPPVVQGLRTVTIKASYRDDIIRFRLPGGAGLMELNNEVSKRLKLEVGTFDVRYLDDDQEWVMLSCDADLKECMEIARLSGVHVIRLSVLDIVSFLGSSCGSTDG